MTAFASSVSPLSLPVNAIEVKGLGKIYGKAENSPENAALKNVDLIIPRGSIFGLIGPNGAGKSTLINILAGLTIKTSGTARVWDCEIDAQPRQAKSAIGIVPQELNLDPFFTPRELLELQAGLYGVPKHERITEELLEAVELTNKADAYSRTLSGGMRRRLMVAKAMVHNPPVLVLDEPTAGVDVDLRRELWNYVRKLNAQGTTILLTTHYLEEAEELCDHIAVIHKGEIVANDSKENLLSRMDKKKIIITLDKDVHKLPDNMNKQGWKQIEPRRFVLNYKPSQNSIGQMLLAVQVNGLSITDITTRDTDLEDIFLQLTKGTNDLR